MNILHLQIPLGDSNIKDNLLIRPELLTQFLQIIKNTLGENYKIICSPCVPSILLEGDDVFKNFDLGNLDVDEFIKLFEEKIFSQRKVNNENT